MAIIVKKDENTIFIVIREKITMFYFKNNLLKKKFIEKLKKGGCMYKNELAMVDNFYRPCYKKNFAT